MYIWSEGANYSAVDSPGDHLHYDRSAAEPTVMISVAIHILIAWWRQVTPYKLTLLLHIHVLLINHCMTIITVAQSGSHHGYT